MVTRLVLPVRSQARFLVILFVSITSSLGEQLEHLQQLLSFRLQVVSIGVVVLTLN